MLAELSFMSICLMMSLIFILGGLIKGFVGQGLPTTTIALLSFFVSPLEAIGLNYLPMLAINGWQFWKADNKAKIARHYAPLALSLICVIAITAFFARSVGNQGLAILMGGTIVVFSAISLMGYRLQISQTHDRKWQYATGGAAGLLGGLTSLWGAPLIMYLLTRPLTPKQFVDVSGFLLLVGCVPLSVGYYATGLFDVRLMFLPGLLAIFFGIVGFQLGALLRPRLNPDLFRTIVLVLFLFMGLRLLLLPLLAR